MVALVWGCKFCMGIFLRSHILANEQDMRPGPGFEKTPASTHKISNLWFHQKWITSSIHYCLPCFKVTSLAAFLRPCVSFEWHFGTITWSWLSCIGAWRTGQATMNWPMSVIFNLECCEHKKGSVGPQTGPLAFNCLHIPFCTPILNLQGLFPAQIIPTLLTYSTPPPQHLIPPKTINIRFRYPYDS